MTVEQLQAQSEKLAQVVEQQKDYTYGKILAKDILAGAMPEDNPDLYATVLLYLSQCLWRSGLSKDAMPYAEQALTITKKNDNKDLQARLFSMIGTLYSSMAEYVQALENYQHALDIDEELGSLTRVASTKGNIGIVYSTLSDFARALAYYQESLRLHQEQENNHGIAGNLHNIGNVYCHLSDYTSALDYYHKSLDLAKYIGSKSGEALCVGAIGNVYIHLDDYESALHYYQQSLLLAQELDNKKSISICMGNIGNVHLELAHFSEALMYFQRALDISREVFHKTGEVLWKGNIGCVYLQKKYERYDRIKGEEYVRESIAYFQEHGIKSHEYEMRKILADLYEEECRWEEFADQFKKYHELKEQVYSEEVQKCVQNNEYQRIIAEKEKQLAIEKTRFQEREAAMKELQKVNQKLIEADKAKNDIISIVAHDLKNPLTLIQLRADILEKVNKDLTEDALITSAKNISSIAQHMNKIITNLLDIHALETGKMPINNVETDIMPIIHKVIVDNRRSASEKNIVIETDISNDIVWVNVDALALYQVLENLLSNAIKFSPKGRSISVICQVENHEVVISVKDNGPGISQEDQSKLFGKFQKLTARPTAGEYSTGLGLSIAKTITEHIGGTLECRSVLGQGAEFIVRLAQSQMYS